MSDKQIELEEQELDRELFPYLISFGDEDHIRHPIVWSQFPVSRYGKSGWNTLVNLQYKDLKDLIEKDLKKKDYDSVFIHLNKETRMNWFIINYKRIYTDVGEEKYYTLLRENLTYVDNHDWVRKHYSKMISYGKDHLLMMSKKERKQFDKLPNKLIIYRGTSSDKKITSSNLKKLLGNSWSLDREISIWFTLKHSPKFRGSKYLILLTYELEKNEVISYFTERNENEIFLDYTKIDLSRVKYEYIPKDYKLKISFNKKPFL